MAKRKIGLNSENIAKLRNYYDKEVKDTISEHKVQKFLEDIAEDVRMELINITYRETQFPSTGEIAASSYARVHTPASTGKTYISIGQSHPDAKYFEYGTGLQGSFSPHPLADEVGWEYNVGDTINGSNIWTYPNEIGQVNPKTGKVDERIPTEGQPAHNQLYLTREYAKMKYPLMARQFFIARFRKVDF